MGLISKARRTMRSLFGMKAVQLIPTWQIGRPKPLNLKYDTMVEDGYSRNEIVFACIRCRADSASEVKVRVLVDEEEVQEEHPLRALLDRPNDYMSLYDLLEATIITQLIAGTAYWEKERDGTGLPVKLWPIRPDRMEVIPGPQGPVGYKYTLGDYTKIFPAEDIVKLTYFNPLDEFLGLSPLVVCARAVDADNERTDFIRAFFNNAAVPYGLFKTKVKLEEGDIEDLRHKWKEQYSGIDNWHNIAIIDVDAEYQQLGLSQTDMAFPELTALSEARICEVFRVPPILVGAQAGLDASTYSNYEQARKAFWEDTMLPSIRKLEDALNLQLGEEFECAIDIDTSEVRALQEDAVQRWTRSGTALVQGWVTVNEARIEAGLERIEGQDVFLRQFGLQVVDESGEMVQQMNPLMPQGPDQQRLLRDQNRDRENPYRDAQDEAHDREPKPQKGWLLDERGRVAGVVEYSRMLDTPHPLGQPPDNDKARTKPNASCSCQADDDEGGGAEDVGGCPVQKGVDPNPGSPFDLFPLGSLKKIADKHHSTFTNALYRYYQEERGIIKTWVKAQTRDLRQAQDQGTAHIWLSEAKQDLRYVMGRQLAPLVQALSPAIEDVGLDVLNLIRTEHAKAVRIPYTKTKEEDENREKPLPPEEFYPGDTNTPVAAEGWPQPKPFDPLDLSEPAPGPYPVVHYYVLPEDVANGIIEHQEVSLNQIYDILDRGAREHWSREMIEKEIDDLYRGFCETRCDLVGRTCSLSTANSMTAERSKLGKYEMIWRANNSGCPDCLGHNGDSYTHLDRYAVPEKAFKQDHELEPQPQSDEEPRVGEARKPEQPDIYDLDKPIGAVKPIFVYKVEENIDEVDQRVADDNREFVERELKRRGAVMERTQEYSKLHVYYDQREPGGEEDIMQTAPGLEVYPPLHPNCECELVPQRKGF